MKNTNTNTSKKEKLTRTQKAAQAYMQLISICDVFDFGKVGKSFELACRSFIENKIERKVKSSGQFDIVSSQFGMLFNDDGTRKKIEIKTGNGEIDNTFNCDIVIYCPVVIESMPFEKQAFCFTIEKWEEMLNGYNSKRGGNILYYNKKRKTTHIQAFYISETRHAKQSKTLANYIWDCCFECPTLAEIIGN